MAEKENITTVVRQKLCNTCGACFAVCNASAIEYKETVGGYYFPHIDNERCVGCGLCLLVCPGINFGQGLMESMPTDPFVGKSLNAFVGKATDNRIYENSQSGGIVSALLNYVLKCKLADAAITVAMDWGDPPRPKPFLARSIDDIFLAQKSKYCPVPILSVIKKILSSNQKIVFVGTACQVHGLLNILDKMETLNHNVSLIIGLICDRVMTYAALDFLIYRSGLSDRNPKLIEFRDKSCGGYPGNVHIKSISGKSIVMHPKKRMRIKDLFTPARCRICFDKMNVFADIVVGDPYGIKDVDQNMGESIAIIRTKRGQQVFNKALEANAYTVREVSYQSILTGQKIQNKRKEWQGYVHAWEELGSQLPNYCQRLLLCRINNVKGPYLNRLKYSLSLDRYSLRIDLLKFTSWQLLKKDFNKISLLPLRIFKRLLFLAYKRAGGWLCISK